jgi:nitrate/nitrite transporter NarK
MGLIMAVTGGLALWIILWALGPTVNLTSFDAFLLALLVILIGATVRVLARYMPGRRR